MYLHSSYLQDRILKNQHNFWWQRKDLYYNDNKLIFAEQAVVDWQIDKPTYVYNRERVLENMNRLRNALLQTNVPFKIHYAMKANRNKKILRALHETGLVGVDVCSPNELLLAIELGFTEKQILYTSSSISKSDWKIISKYPQISLQLDSISAIKRAASYGWKQIGIRLNPSLGLGYDESLEYSGKGPSKFGIYSDRMEEAISVAVDLGMEVDTLHFHAGSGYLSAQLSNLERILASARPLILKYGFKKLNIGGGLGVPQKKGDFPLDLDRWSKILGDFSRELGLEEIITEPGDYLVKDAGILIGEVTFIEEKGGLLYLGLNLGMNVNYEYAYYKMNLEAVPILLKDGPTRRYTLAGNINEPVDLMGEGVILSGVEEGDLIALLNTGGYGASTASNHCMRGDFIEITL